MTTVTIKIENNNLGKAKTEVEALLVYIDTLAKTYETASISEDKPAPKKRVVKKAPIKDEVKPEPKEEVKEIPEPVQEEKPVETPSETTLTLADMTALAKEAVAGSDRDKVKDLIASYGKGKLSTVDADKFVELAEELKALA